MIVGCWLPMGISRDRFHDKFLAGQEGRTRSLKIDKNSLDSTLSVVSSEQASASSFSLPRTHNKTENLQEEPLPSFKTKNRLKWKITIANPTLSEQALLDDTEISNSISEFAEPLGYQHILSFSRGF